MATHTRPFRLITPYLYFWRLNTQWKEQLIFKFKKFKIGRESVLLQCFQFFNHCFNFLLIYHRIFICNLKKNFTECSSCKAIYIKDIFYCINKTCSLYKQHNTYYSTYTQITLYFFIQQIFYTLTTITNRANLFHSLNKASLFYQKQL